MQDQKTRFAVVIPAAGSGKRFGGGDKLLTDLAGKSVLQRAVGVFACRADVGQIVVVTGEERFGEYREHLRGVIGEAQRHKGTEAQRDDDYLCLVKGGRERWESVLFGLRAVRADLRYVAVHDAARPLTSQAVIDAAFAGAVEVGGSVPCLAEPATLKRVGADGLVSETVSRAGLFQAQTPQCFELAGLRGAYEQLVAEGRVGDVTDDAQVFERVGRKVKGTLGEAGNMKITTAEDVAVARGVLGGRKGER